MTIEEARKRAEEAEKRKKHEYYIANRDRIREKQREYAKRTRPARSANEKKCREAKPLQYAETQLRYWQRKEDESRMRYWTRKVNKLKEVEQ